MYAASSKEIGTKVLALTVVRYVQERVCGLGLQRAHFSWDPPRVHLPQTLLLHTHTHTHINIIPSS